MRQKEELKVNMRFKENVSEQEEDAIWTRVFTILAVFEEEETKKEILLNK